MEALEDHHHERGSVWQYWLHSVTPILTVALLMICDDLLDGIEGLFEFVLINRNLRLDILPQLEYVFDN